MSNITLLNADEKQFENMQRKAKMLAQSTAYAGIGLIGKANGDITKAIANTLVVMSIADETGFSPIMVNNNINIIHGNIAFSSSFIIAAMAKSKKWSPLNYHLSDDLQECYCTSIYLQTGEKYKGMTVTMEIAKAEGWLGKTGSKWKTMPELMLRYRAATFFVRQFCPDVLFGGYEEHEAMDMRDVKENTEFFDVTPVKEPEIVEQRIVKTEKIKSKQGVDKKPAPSEEVISEPVVIEKTEEVVEVDNNQNDIAEDEKTDNNDDIDVSDFFEV